jgi:hypothetical protein
MVQTKIINMKTPLSRLFKHYDISDNVEFYDFDSKDLLDCDYVGSKIKNMIVKEIWQDTNFELVRIYVSET